MENASWSKINVMTCLTSHYVPKTSSTVLSSYVGGPRLLVHGMLMTSLKELETNSYVTKHRYQPCRTLGRWIKENICFSVALKQFCFFNSRITSLFLRAMFKRKKNRRELTDLVKNSVLTIFQIWAKVEEYQETSFSFLKTLDNADHPLKIPPLPFWLSLCLPPPSPVSLSVPFSMRLKWDGWGEFCMHV